MMVTMSMEEYKALETVKEKEKMLKRISRELMSQHCSKNPDWCVADEVETALNLEETKLLLSKIME